MCQFLYTNKNKELLHIRVKGLGHLSDDGSRHLMTAYSVTSTACYSCCYFKLSKSVLHKIVLFWNINNFLWCSLLSLSRGLCLSKIMMQLTLRPHFSVHFDRYPDNFTGIFLLLYILFTKVKKKVAFVKNTCKTCNILCALSDNIGSFLQSSHLPVWG